MSPGRFRFIAGEDEPSAVFLGQEELSGDLGPILIGHVGREIVHCFAAILGQSASQHRQLVAELHG